MSWTSNLTDANLKNLATASIADGSVSYSEMLALLSGAATGGMTASKYTDLKAIDTNFQSLYASDYLKSISGSMIYTSKANESWWGGVKTMSGVASLGNLSASSSQDKVSKLVSKWFLGTDLPMPISGGDSATGKTSSYSFNYATATGELFVNGVAASDINQGYAGDCYLVAALGAIANAKPSIITDMFTDNANGTLGVKFYGNSGALYTTVDKSLPVYGSKLAFAGDINKSTSGELWVALAEKAYVQLNTQIDVDNKGPDWTGENSYQAIEGGFAQAIKQVAGLNYKYYSSYYSGVPDAYKTAEYVSGNAQTYKQTFIDALKGGSIGWLASFGKTTGANGKQDLVAGHAYMLLGYNAETDKFIIRNPWGGTGSNYNPQFEASIESFWNSSVKGIVALSDATVADTDYGYTIASSAADASGAVTEGGNVSFTITRSGSGTASTVYLATTPGTAGSNDYAAFAKTALTFSAYETTKTITVNTYKDEATEGAESFSLSLFKGQGDSTAAVTAAAHIKDAASTNYSYTVSSTAGTSANAVAEGNAATFTITRSGSGTSSTVYLNTRAGTAGNSDYAGFQNQAVTFAAYETTKTISIDTYKDGSAEGTESFALDLYKTLGDAYVTTANAYIKDAATANYIYTVTSNAGTSSNAVEEGGTVTFTIKRSGSGTASTVYVAAAPGTAGAQDYVNLEKQAVTFEANQTVATLSVKVNEDWWLEPVEYFKLALYKNITDTSYATSAAAYIKDKVKTDYNYSIVSSAGSSGDAVTEGGQITFTITRDGSGAASTVYLKTANASAGSDDYNGFDKTAVSFAAYETIKTVTINTYQDTKTEGSEAFALQLYRNYADSSYSAWSAGYIKDAAVANYSYTVSSNAESSSTAVTEGGSITFTITRSGSGSASTVYLSTTPSTAGSSDYAALNRQAVTFAAYETTKTITVSTYQDSSTEGTEYFWLDLFKNYGDSDYAAYGQGYIKDAPVANYNYTITSDSLTSSGAVTEGGKVTFTVTRSGSGSASTVYVKTLTGTASGYDYGDFGKTAVTFGAHETSKTVTVDTYKDAYTEGAEYFYLTLYKNYSADTYDSWGYAYVKDAPIITYNYTISSANGTQANAMTEGGKATFTITRSGSGSESTVYVSTTDGSAGSSDYYGISKMAVTFGASETSKTVTVNTYEDSTTESTEYFWLDLYKNYTDASYATYGVAYIKDAPVVNYTYTISSSASSSANAVTEGDNVTFTITRNGSATASTVYLRTYSGSATDDYDYASKDKVALTFAAGETSKTFTVATYKDSIVETDEYFWLDLFKNYSDSTYATYASAYIKDLPDNYDYTVTSSASSSSTAVTEGGDVTFTITRNGSGTASTVYLRTYSGSATGGYDYANKDMVALSFAAGETSKTFTVSTYEDTATEGTEYFWLDLFKNYNDSSYATYGSAYIKDAVSNNYNYTVSSSASSSSYAVTEGGDVTFTITRSGSGTESTVYLLTESGTATDGLDYASKNKVALTFAATETSKTFTVSTYQDSATETMEYFWLSLYKNYDDSSYSTYGLAYIAEAVANDYDYTITTSASNSSHAVAEGQDVTFTITRSGSSTASTIYLLTESGTATEGVDYASHYKTALSFAAGETSKTFTVSTFQDTTTESQEFFWLSLFKNYSDTTYTTYNSAYIKDASTSTGYNYTVTTGAASSSSSVAEGGTVTFIVTRDGSTTASTVYLSTKDSTASGGSDYGILDKLAVTFAAGETSKTVTVDTYADSHTEGMEYFYLELFRNATDTTNSGYTWAYIGESAGDQVTYTVSSGGDSGTASVTEGSPITFTITRSNSSQASTVYVSTYASTAAGDDYTPLDKTPVTFAAGETTKTVTVQTKQDTLTEGAEMFYLDLYTSNDGSSWNTYGYAYITDPGYTESAAFPAQQAFGAGVGAGAGASDLPSVSFPGHSLGEFRNNHAFAAIRFDGAVVTWGDAANGGSSSAVASKLDGSIDATALYSTTAAFAALRSDGSVVTWGNINSGGDATAVAAKLDGTTDVQSIHSTTSAFAALRSDGSVVTWGDSTYGGDSSGVAASLDGSTDVTKVYSNASAFAALRSDGSVVTWGDASSGGDSSSVAAGLNGSTDVTRIYSTTSAFAALRSDGSVVTWGGSFNGGDSSAVTSQLDGSVDVTAISATTSAFAALRSDGSVVTWGDFNSGGDSTDLTDQLDGTTNVTKIFSTGSAFAALRADGSVAAWGDRSAGGDASTVSSMLDGTTDVTQIYATASAFAALRADGSVVTWGDASFGGDSSTIAGKLDGSTDVVKIFATDQAFAALRADGSVVAWGGGLAGGDSSEVAADLDGSIDVTQIYATSQAFAALRADGSVITWGDNVYGGDKTSVKHLLASIGDAADIYSDDAYAAAAGVTGTAGNDTLNGTASGEVITGLAGDDTMTGNGGNDVINGGEGIDTAVYSGTLASYMISGTASARMVSGNSEGTDTLSGVEKLKFSDKTVNLTVKAAASGIAAADLKLLQELYVAFFNRVPDADGLEYWIGQFKSGQTIKQIAEVFYSAGVAASAVTGYSATMTDADFVNRVYSNVLGRTTGADADGLKYWTEALAKGDETKGSLVSTILSSAHTFKGHETWGWVADLLDNKAAVANTFAVDYGLNFNTAEASITEGMNIAAKVTSADTGAALTLIGIDPATFAI